MFYLVKTPRFITNLFKNYTWFKPAGSKTIHLTFDDGPHPVITEFVLKTLNEFNAKATFFCLGKNVIAQPDMYLKIIEQGHAVGNHTFNHVNGWKVKDAVYLDDVQQAAEHIDSKLFRPPYGRITPFQATQLRLRGYEIIMWSVLSGDFDVKLTADKCLENLLLHTNDGDIVVFHDSEKAFEKVKAVLPKFLKHYTDKGFQFKSLHP